MLSYVNVCIFLISVPGDGQLLSKPNGSAPQKWLFTNWQQNKTKTPMWYKHTNECKFAKIGIQNNMENANGYILQTTMVTPICEILIINTMHLHVLHFIHAIEKQMESAPQKWLFTNWQQNKTKTPMWYKHTNECKFAKIGIQNNMENANGYILQTTMVTPICETLITNTMHLHVLHSIHWQLIINYNIDSKFGSKKNSTCYCCWLCPS